MTDPEFLFPAQILAVVDGDTVDVRLDLGFEIYTEERVRLSDVDTAEVHGVDKDSAEYRQGMKHSEATREWVGNARNSYDGDWPFLLHSDHYERGVYGRVIGQIEARETGDTLQSYLKRRFTSLS